MKGFPTPNGSFCGYPPLLLGFKGTPKGKPSHVCGVQRPDLSCRRGAFFPLVLRELLLLTARAPKGQLGSEEASWAMPVFSFPPPPPLTCCFMDAPAILQVNQPGRVPNLPSTSTRQIQTANIPELCLAAWKSWRWFQHGSWPAPSTPG